MNRYSIAPVGSSARPTAAQDYDSCLRGGHKMQANVSGVTGMNKTQHASMFVWTHTIFMLYMEIISNYTGRGYAVI